MTAPLSDRHPIALPRRIRSPCLESVTRHAPVGTEILVVDDGSPDASISFTALDFPNVRIIRHSRSKGFCAVANAGIVRTRRIVELLNDDTQVTRGWAGAVLKCFEDTTIGAVAPLVLQGTPDECDK